MTQWTQWQCELGTLIAVATDGYLSGLYLEGQKHQAEIADNWQEAPNLPLFTKLKQQLEDYCQGSRTDFDLPLAPQGTAFQQRVWHALQQITYGEIAQYGQLASAIGKPSATRAVAAAIGRNPLMILIPCHRVVGANGKLTGFAAGLHTKAKLLALEAPKTLELRIDHQM
ncbi:methylated-DNA--[protein]-cysteine S-methyltransferase [Motiliproteus sp. MSK22-1]|uniref:methylated-DNA--[protein]-cysteine S-methyltransferase n=1 Tax=Motiliproteus sp. MSK22-1 TaxID=1897630 RepID=UPI0009779152|nr:methylated-DNA--[protein]-cysteine S-methyltransferase [Motiliproteus sp. MSK22-1]OMH28115.1 hypothetical protein BGP75_22385 [Motiliproteus sp. MSK22-1]